MRAWAADSLVLASADEATNVIEATANISPNTFLIFLPPSITMAGPTAERVMTPDGRAGLIDKTPLVFEPLQP
jgi:hypothetical protein